MYMTDFVTKFVQKPFNSLNLRVLLNHISTCMTRSSDIINYGLFKIESLTYMYINVFFFFVPMFLPHLSLYFLFASIYITRLPVQNISFHFYRTIFRSLISHIHTLPVLVNICYYIHVIDKIPTNNLFCRFTTLISNYTCKLVDLSLWTTGSCDVLLIAASYHMVSAVDSRRICLCFKEILLVFGIITS